VASVGSRKPPLNDRPTDSSVNTRSTLSRLYLVWPHSASAAGPQVQIGNGFTRSGESERDGDGGSGWWVGQKRHGGVGCVSQARTSNRTRGRRDALSVSAECRILSAVGVWFRAGCLGGAVSIWSDLVCVEEEEQDAFQPFLPLVHGPTQAEQC
jgi:hypothetical protein